MKATELREQLLTAIVKSNTQPSEILMVLDEVKDIVNVLNKNISQPKVENKNKEDTLAGIIASALKSNNSNIEIEIVPVSILETVDIFNQLVRIRNDLNIIGKLL